MAASDAKMEAEAAARRAPMEVATKLTAGLTTGASGQSGTTQSSPLGLATNPMSTAAATGGVPGAQYVPSGAQVQASYTPGEIYRDFNDQQTKAAFSQQQAESAAPNVGRPADPTLLPYTIFAGTIIPAALETAINTDLPGDVLATVAENVYDSVSGKNLLIPQGSKLLAQYSSNVSFGQSRVQVAWQRLIRPDGLSLQLANMNGVDPQGMSGYPGSVDQHWWEYAKGIGLMALFSIIDGQLQYSIKTATTQGLSDVANSLTSGIDQVGTQYTSNAMNIQPTIIVKQGAKVQVFVNSDIIMPPANQRKVFQKYSIPKEGRRERMKKRLVLVAAMGVMLSGCYLFVPNGTTGVTSITVDPSYLTVGPGEQVTVNVTTDPPGAAGDISWKCAGRLLRRRVRHKHGRSDHWKAPGLNHTHRDSRGQVDPGALQHRAIQRRRKRHLHHKLGNCDPHGPGGLKKHFCPACWRQ